MVSITPVSTVTEVSLAFSCALFAAALVTAQAGKILDSTAFTSILAVGLLTLCKSGITSNSTT